MLTRRVGLLVGAVIFMGTLGAGSMAPAQAEASCRGYPATSPIVYQCTNYEGHVCINTTPDEYGGLCVDPNNVCVGEDCLSGVQDQIDYIRDEVNSLDDPVRELADDALAEVTALVGELQEMLDEEICVAPFDPYNPVCFG